MGVAACVIEGTKERLGKRGSAAVESRRQINRKGGDYRWLNGDHSTIGVADGVVVLADSNREAERG